MLVVQIRVRRAMLRSFTPEHLAWNRAPPCLFALLEANVLSAIVVFPQSIMYTAPPFSAWFSVNVLVMIWTVDALLAATPPPAQSQRALYRWLQSAHRLSYPTHKF